MTPAQLQARKLLYLKCLYKDGVELAIHADIDDEAQTVSYPEQPEIPAEPEQPQVPKTGDNRWLLLVLTSSLLVSAALFVGIILHKKMHGENSHS